MSYVLCDLGNEEETIVQLTHWPVQKTPFVRISDLFPLKPNWASSDPAAELRTDGRKAQRADPKLSTGTIHHGCPQYLARENCVS